MPKKIETKVRREPLVSSRQRRVTIRAGDCRSIDIGPDAGAARRRPGPSLILIQSPSRYETCFSRKTLLLCTAPRHRSPPDSLPALLLPDILV